MTDVLTPAERAAAEAIEQFLMSPTEAGFATWIEHDDALARVAVAAARRHIAAKALRDAATDARFGAAHRAVLTEMAAEIEGGSDA